MADPAELYEFEPEEMTDEERREHLKLCHDAGKLARDTRLQQAAKAFLVAVQVAALKRDDTTPPLTVKVAANLLLERGYQELKG